MNKAVNPLLDSTFSHLFEKENKSLPGRHNKSHMLTIQMAIFLLPLNISEYH